MKAKANLFRTLLLVPVLLVAVAVALFGVGLRTAEPQTTTASTTPYYKVQDLGTLGGDSDVQANQANGATSINDSGRVIGTSFTSDGRPHAFLYDENATPKMQDLGTLGGNYSGANSINDSGKVVGSSYTNDGEQHAFLYNENATPKMQDLNDLLPADSGWIITEATAINSDGKIAAYGGDTYPAGYGTGFAVVLTPATTATTASYEVEALGSLWPDSSGVCPCGVPTSINDSGQVAGTEYYGEFGSHAFLYDASATPKMQDLGTLPDSWRSEAAGINDSGQVVGHSANRAFLKESGQPMIDLNTLIPADSGWSINEAKAINSDGKI